MSTSRAIVSSLTLGYLLLAGFTASAGPLTGKTLSASGSPSIQTRQPTVGPGLEFSLGTDFQFDFDEDGILRFSLGPRDPAFGEYSILRYVFEFTDVLSAIDEIVGFELVSQGERTAEYGAPILSFDADAVRIDMAGRRWFWGETTTLRVLFAADVDPGPEPELPADPTLIPEPVSATLAGSGLFALAYTSRRRRQLRPTARSDG